VDIAFFELVAVEFDEAYIRVEVRDTNSSAKHHQSAERAVAVSSRLWTSNG
jgi:hypothetical protein